MILFIDNCLQSVLSSTCSSTSRVRFIFDCSFLRISTITFNFSKLEKIVSIDFLYNFFSLLNNLLGYLSRNLLLDVEIAMREFEFSVITYVILSSILIAVTAGLTQETNPNYYEILELSEDCSQEDVKKAFRRLARKYHPDKCKDPDAQEKFQKLGEGNQLFELRRNEFH